MNQTSLFRRTLVLFLLVSNILITLNAQAQKHATEWTNYHTEKGLVIDYKFTSCERNRGYDQENVLLRISNSSIEVKEIYWEAQVWRGDKCTTCGDNAGEYVRIVKVLPGQSIEGVCDDSGDFQLKIFSKFTDAEYKLEQAPLTRFTLGNLKVDNYIN